MIVRIWHGRVPHEKAASYRDFLSERAIPDYRGVPGNLGVFVLERPAADAVHFVTLTYWTNLEAIHAFAGEDVLKAKYYPEDKDYLLEFEPEVVHYTVADATVGVDRLANLIPSRE